MSVTLVLVGAISAAISGAGGYLLRRKLERKAEHEAVAIEQARLLLLKDVSGMVATLDPATKERATPLLAAAVERTLEAVSRPPSSDVAINGRASPELRLRDELERSRQDIAAKLEADRRRREELHAMEDRHQQFWIDMYRLPLIDMCQHAALYAMLSAEVHTKSRDLTKFKEDWDVFKSAVKHWLLAVPEEDRPEIRKTIASASERFEKWFNQFGEALRTQDGAPPAVAAPEPATTS